MNLMQVLIASAMLAGSFSCQDVKDPAFRDFTIHFHANSLVQTGWQLKIGDLLFKPSNIDSFGSRFDIRGDYALTTVELISSDQSLFYNLKSDSQYWLFEASDRTFTAPPPILPQTQEVAIYYSSDIEGFDTGGLHIWDPARGEWTRPQEPLAFTTPPGAVYGAGALVPLPPATSLSGDDLSYERFPEYLGLNIYRGASKSAAGDLSIQRNLHGNILFFQEADTTTYCSPDFQPCADDHAL